MTELIQLSSTVAVPERTAELAMRYPGVRKVLDMGIDVRHYLDKREAETAPVIEEVVSQVVDPLAVTASSLPPLRRVRPGVWVWE